MRLRRLYDFAQRVLRQGRRCRSRSCSVSLTVTVLPHPHGSPLTQVVVGIVCGIRIDAGALGGSSFRNFSAGRRGDQAIRASPLLMALKVMTRSVLLENGLISMQCYGACTPATSSVVARR